MREIRSRGIGATATVFALAALSGCGDGLTPDELARAGEFRLSVEEAARMVAPVPGLPNDPTVLRAVVDFWVDYTLLAHATNTEGEVQRLDLSHVMALQTANTLVERLRSQVIQVREVTEADLRSMFEQNRYGVAVRARHVLLRYPDSALPAQRDSVRRLAEEIRDQARSGVDFAALAQRYSADTGSGAVGGDLGFFERGQMVLPFEDAAFALQPGAVSDVVPTEFGLHIIKVEERREPAFEEIAQEYRAQVEFEGMAQAESIYLASVEGPANIQLEEGAIAFAREVALGMNEEMGGGTAGRALVRYEGGAYTAGDLRDFLLGQPPELRDQVNQAPDEQVEGFLRDLTRDMLLVADAERRGISVLPEELVAYEGELRAQYQSAAEILGLHPIEPEAGGTLADAVDRRVKEMMARVIRGEQEIVPLGGLANPLRERYSVSVSTDAIDRAVSRTEGLREQGFTTPPPASPPAGQ